MSRDDLALGPRIRVEVGQVVPYRGGGSGRVLVINAKSPQGAESTYPIFTQDEKTGAVFSHRVDGLLGIPNGSPYDIQLSPSEVHVRVRIYRDTLGNLHSICAVDRAPDTPLPWVGEGEVVIKVT